MLLGDFVPTSLDVEAIHCTVVAHSIVTLTYPLDQRIHTGRKYDD